MRLGARPDEEKRSILSNEERRRPAESPLASKILPCLTIWLKGGVTSSQRYTEEFKIEAVRQKSETS